MLAHGPVRVPKDAKPGNATMRIEMPKTSKYKSFPTDLPVVIR